MQSPSQPETKSRETNASDLIHKCPRCGGVQFLISKDGVAYCANNIGNRRRACWSGRFPEPKPQS